MRWLLVLAAVGRLAAQSCGISVSPAYFDGTGGSGPIPANGGTYTITFSGNLNTCPWTAAVSPGASWITLGETSGMGPGVLTWTAALNPTNSPRSGAISLRDWTIPVVQLANTCVPTLPVTSAQVAVGGGSGIFSIQTICQWNVGNNPNWITLQAPTNGTGNGSVNYTVAANGCVAGRSATVTAYSGTLNPNASDSSATFTINQDGSPSNLTLSPTSVTLTAAGGMGSVTVNTPKGCGWSAYTDQQGWIQFVGAASGTGTAAITYKALANTTGVARPGNIYVGGSVFTIYEQAAAAPVPQLTAVANAASYASGPIAPGEVVALGGTGLGPKPPGASVQLAANGQSITTTLGGVQVLFDGKYPAALTYVSDQQINAIAPYEIAGETSTQITVQYQGGTSAALQAQVAAAAPGIFTGNFMGTGQGAILNQDYSVNGISYPAAPGSIVMIYCSGAGVTDPASTDAAITPSSPPFPALVNQPVTVTIGGIAAQVQYSGSAPGAVAGLTQINAFVPSNAPTGPSVPVVIQIGTWQSQAGVTMVVQ